MASKATSATSPRSLTRSTWRDARRNAVANDHSGQCGLTSATHHRAADRQSAARLSPKVADALDVDRHALAVGRDGGGSRDVILRARPILAVGQREHPLG